MKYSSTSVSIAVFILSIAVSYGVITEAQRLSREPSEPILASSYSLPVPDLEAREIGTKNRLWLNGYLGLFFNFKRVGYFSWLILPLLIVFFADIKKRRNWEIAIAFTYILSAIVIAIKGSFNYRYALTLIPFNVAFILAYGRDVSFVFNRLLRAGAYGGMTILTVFNFLHFNPDMFKVISPQSRDGLPWKIIDTINDGSLERDAAFLVCNAPAFHYYTNKRGFAYEKRFFYHKPGILTEKGIVNIFQEETGIFNRDPERLLKAFEVMKDQFNIKYVFINRLPEYFIELDEFIRYGCDLLESEKSFSLYKLKDRFIHPLLEVERKKPTYQNDFSQWKGQETIPSVDLANALPPLMELGVRGEFKMRVLPDGEVHVLKVTPVKANENGERLVFFGCWPNHNGFDISVPPGKDVVFRIMAKLSGQTKIPTKIIIEDEQNGWEMSWTDIDLAGWQQYTVTRRVREKATDVLIGVIWQPERETDSLEIRGLEIFII